MKVNRKPNKVINSKDCNADIFFGDTNNQISVADVSDEKYKGPKFFDYTFIDFKDCFVKQINSLITLERRIYKNQDDLKVVGLTNSCILDSLKKITEIANMSIDKVRNEGFDHVYRTHLANICFSVYKLVDDDNCDVIVPLRGGALVASLVPIKKNKVIAIDCKRVPLIGSRGSMGFGMRLDYDSIQNSQLTLKKIHKITGKVRILEVCLASGMTTAGLLLDFYSRGYCVKDVEVIAPVMAQQGYELVKKVSKFTKINVTFATGAMFYRLGNFYDDNADSLMTDDGRYVVGNATEILKSFLPSFIK